MFKIRYTVSTGNDGKVALGCKKEKSIKWARDNKGISANKYVSDYCVLDLETTGVFVKSSEIIEIAAIKVRENKVVAEFSTLVNPQCHIPEEATAVNHITDDMVKDAPLLEYVIDELLAFVGNDVIVGYNNAAFDMNLIYDRVYKLRGISFSNDYLDILHASRRSIEGIQNYKLETISNYYDFDTEGEHRALKDCYLTKSCYEKIYEEFGDEAFKKRNYYSSDRRMRYSEETVALQELHILLDSILEDGEITLDEIDSLRYWVEEHRDLSGHYPFDKAFNALDDVLEDGQITCDEQEDLKNIFAEIVDPVKNKGCHDQIRTLLEKNVCLTGEFEYGEKYVVENLIKNAGGVIDKTVKKSTDYLVVGSLGSDAWKAGNYGGKVQKAMEYNNKFSTKGINIKIVEEQEFIPAVQYLLEHPEECECEAEKDPGSFDWKFSVQTMLETMVVEEELPENSLYLMPNYGRDGKTITSYSVCIYEPDYPLAPKAKKDPTRNYNVINIKENGSMLELMVGKVRFGDIGSPKDAKVKEIKSDQTYMHVFVPADSSELVDYIKQNTKYAMANYTSKASSFGCCSKFIECSDAKKCVHVNKLYSKACIYRGHLDAGRIFYGKNRNVD